MEMIEPLSQAQQTFLKEHERHIRTVKLCRILLFALFLCIWEIAASQDWIDSFIFSSPSRLCQLFFKMCQDGSLFSNLKTTIIEVFISFFFIMFLGIGTAVLLWFFPKLSEIFEPSFVVLNSLPKSALAPLLIVWLGANMRTIIVAGISVALFGTIINIYTSFKEVDEEKIKLIYTLQGRKYHVLLKVILPCCVPALLSIMKVDIGLALVGVIIGEFLCSRQGLGHLIMYGSQVFRLDLVILSIVLLCFLAMALYKILGLVENRITIQNKNKPYL